VGWPISHALKWRTQYRYAPASVLAALAWFVLCIAALGFILAAAPDWETATELADRLAAPLLVGFAAQLIIGALSFLIPVVLGGGPTIARATNAELDRLRWPRLVLINLGVLAALAPLHAGARAAAGFVVLACFATFLVLAARAVLIARHR
jgi:nitrite reductase (NO-forming)